MPVTDKWYLIYDEDGNLMGKITEAERVKANDRLEAKTKEQLRRELKELRAQLDAFNKTKKSGIPTPPRSPFIPPKPTFMRGQV